MRAGAKAKGEGREAQVEGVLEGEGVGDRGAGGSGGGGSKAAMAVQECLAEMQQGGQGSGNGCQKGKKRKLPWQQGSGEAGGEVVIIQSEENGVGDVKERREARAAAARTNAQDVERGDEEYPEAEHF
jgi:hypothetical protein